MSEFKGSADKGDGKPLAKVGGKSGKPVVKSATGKPHRPAIVMDDTPAPTLSEMIESAVAPVAAAATPDAVPVPASASVEAVAATDAAPVPVAAPEAEPAAAISTELEDVRSATDPAPALRPMPATSRGIFEMATTFDTATTNPAVAAEKVKAMFGGLNDRAKTAMEKSAKLGEEFGELTKGNVEALVASGKVAAKGAESMAQEAVEYGKKNFETATTMFKSFAGVKSPTELFQLQSDFAKSSFDSAVAEASKLSEAWVKLAGEMVQPLSNRYAVAAEKLKSAAM